MVVGDLAQAIVDMTAAARGRRESMVELRDVVTLITTRIVQALRVGDAVPIKDSDGNEVAYEVAQVSWPCSAGGASPTFVHPKGAKVLLRGGAVLADPDQVQSAMPTETLPPLEPSSSTKVGYLSETYNQAPLAWQLHYANGDELAAFTREAQAVVDAFRLFLEAQHADFTTSAKSVSKLQIK